MNSPEDDLKDELAEDLKQQFEYEFHEGRSLVPEPPNV